jgi:hypothetical protein
MLPPTWLDYLPIEFPVAHLLLFSTYPQMFHPFSSNGRLLLDIILGLYPMNVSKYRSQIMLPVLTTINKSDNMVTIPRFTSPNRSASEIANAAITLKNPKTYPRGYRTVICLPYPFFC